MSVKADCLLRLPWALLWRVWEFVQDHRLVHWWLLFENYPYFSAFSSQVIVCLGNWSAWLESKWQASYRRRRQCEETLRRSIRLYWWERWSHWNRMIIMTTCNHHRWHDGPEAGERAAQDRKPPFDCLHPAVNTSSGHLHILSLNFVWKLSCTLNASTTFTVVI